MLSQTMQESLNNQLNAELYSAYLYWSMCAHFEASNLKGFANWMRVQAQEEMVHAVKFFNYITTKGGRVTLQALEAPPSRWGAVAEPFQAAYEHEKKITGKIYQLATQAIEEKDHGTNAFLQWFVTEQVEEEASVSAVVDNLKLAKDSAGGLLLLDRELAQRVFAPPPDMAGAAA